MHILIAALHRPLQPTGVCRHAANLAQCLAESKTVNRVSIVIGAWQKQYFDSFLLTNQKIEVISINIPNTSISRNLWYLSGLPKLAKQLNSDLVHFAFPIPCFRSQFSCPIVTTVHDLYPYECPENFGRQAIFNRLFLKQCVSQSNALACVSRSTQNQLKQYLPDESARTIMAVIYNYIDFSRVCAIPVQQLSGLENVPFLLCVAQHRKNKNLDLLIRAYASLEHRSTSLRKLIIVGSNGPETENLLSLISSLSLKGQVLLLSSIEDGELRWLYEHCEVFVIPSSTEGFCLPLAEALLLSCKVVCSDIPIFREIGSSTCTYFHLHESETQSLESAILQSIAQADRRASPDHRFSKDRVAEQYLTLYSKVL